METSQVSLYLHIPFCQAKCSYCDFNSHPGLQPLFRPYAAALETEIRWMGQSFGQGVPSLFLGGGTPSLLPLELLGAILDACRQAFRIEDRAEISCEANPGTVGSAGLKRLRQMGVNRLSLGAQSFDRHELTMLGRIHDAQQVPETVRQARLSGFENLNLDLIYGLPGQTLSTWQKTLDQALALEPDHLALYALSLEEGTPLREQVESGHLPWPDPDLAADMYDRAGEMLVSEGYACYEISNWCRPGFECAHNLRYWRNQPYLGLGAGAHSSDVARRWWNEPGVPAYIDRMKAAQPGSWPSPAAVGGENLSKAVQMGETMMLGLRLTREGVSLADFEQRFGMSLEAAYGDVIRDLSRLGLLEQESGSLRLTSRGRLVGNQAFARFLPDPD